MKPKFRGFRTKSDEWVEGCLIYREEPYLHDIVVPIGDSSNISYAVDRNSIGQYSGLKDKNDVEIFEGDIVERVHLFNGSFGEKHTGEVVYDKEYARYVISKPHQHTKLETEELRNALSDVSTYEVIGNIWENPELLEEEK